MEVSTPVGRVDLLNNNLRLTAEVKELSNWKHALGQILSYGAYHPEYQMKIYLFSADKSSIDDHTIVDIARNICGQYGVLVELV